MSKRKIKENMVCVIHANNRVGFKECDILLGRTIERIKYRPFKMSEWSVEISIESLTGIKDQPNTIITCFESDLTPCEDNIVIRYPVNMPEVNNLDINCLEMILNYLASKDDIDPKLIDRMSMMVLKLNFYKQMTEV